MSLLLRILSHVFSRTRTIVPQDLAAVLSRPLQLEMLEQRNFLSGGALTDQTANLAYFVGNLQINLSTPDYHVLQVHDLSGTRAFNLPLVDANATALSLKSFLLGGNHLSGNKDSTLMVVGDFN